MRGHSFPIFLGTIANGTNWVILNLKELDQTLEYNYFKLQAIYLVAHLIKQNYHIMKIDLKDAHYFCKKNRKTHKIAYIFVGSKLLKFVALPNGLLSGPRKFTNLTST